MVSIGVDALELCSTAYAEFAVLADGKRTRKIMDDNGIKCLSCHFEMAELRTKQNEAIAWAKDIGMVQMGTASLGQPGGHGGPGLPGMDAPIIALDVIKRAADEYNKIGEQAAKAGIQQFLHDENFEVSKVDGRLTYEVLLELLDPKLVKMQFQMSAMREVGDPVTYFTKYPGRFLSMHLQGVAADTTVAVGKDGLDWPRIFTAAKTGGVKNYFVELSWDLTVPSVAYLKTIK
jgi:sugar phosphate isomerase/epimerase